MVGPGLNLGRFFVSKARYFGPKLAGFCGPKRAGPKNRLKTRFWLAQSPPKDKKKIRAGRARPRAQKFCPKPGQKAGRAKMITSIINPLNLHTRQRRRTYKNWILRLFHHFVAAVLVLVVGWWVVSVLVDETYRLIVQSHYHSK